MRGVHLMMLMKKMIRSVKRGERVKEDLRFSL